MEIENSYASEDDEMEVENSHLLSDQIKYAIVHFKLIGFSNKETARSCGEMYNRESLSHQTVKAIWNKYQRTNTIKNEWCNVGRERALGEDEILDLVEFLTSNPKKSISEARVALNIKASRPSINKALLGNGFRAYRAPKKFYISPTNIDRRLVFAIEHRKHKENYWKKVLFSDESSFSLVSANGRTLVRRFSGEEYQPHSIQQKRLTQSLMVWGIISYKGVGPLVRIDKIEEGETTLNGARYLKLLQKYLLQAYPGLKENKLKFVQDNAPSHRCLEVYDWLEEKGVDRMFWPPQSPDINLIEGVWNEIKYRLRGKVFENKDGLWKSVKKEWRSISKEFIKGLYESLPRRIAALEEAEGKHTKY